MVVFHRLRIVQNEAAAMKCVRHILETALSARLHRPSQSSCAASRHRSAVRDFCDTCGVRQDGSCWWRPPVQRSVFTNAENAHRDRLRDGFRPRDPHKTNYHHRCMRAYTHCMLEQIAVA
jgi:hypothetical protein